MEADCVSAINLTKHRKIAPNQRPKRLSRAVIVRLLLADLYWMRLGFVWPYYSERAARSAPRPRYQRMIWARSSSVMPVTLPGGIALLSPACR